MTEAIENYVLAAALSEITAKQSTFEGGYQDYSKTFDQIDKALPIEIPHDVIERVIQELLNLEVIETISDDAAGTFYKIKTSKAVNIVNERTKTQTSLVYKYRAVGSQFLEAAVARLLPTDEKIEGDEVNDVGAEVPASDRIVTLSHNEISEFDERSSEIIELTEALNGIEGEPGLREVIVGQLKAGRELVRAGSLRLYLLQVTLIDALKFLAVRYEKEAIGALAAALLTALISHFGLPA